MNNELIIKKDLFPLIPLVNYSKVPVFPWSNEKYQLKSENELQGLENIYIQEVNGVQRGGVLTGYSLLTGKKSGIIVIDLDKNHGDGSINGIEQFNEFISELSNEDKEIIKNTFSIKTPRGGQHLYFKYKEGLKNKANYIKGVDIRTDGGLIVLPYSEVKNESIIGRYEILNDGDILDMPQLLFNKFIELDKPKVKPMNKEVSQVTDIKKFTNKKYYKVVEEGGRDAALISWLGFMIKENQNLRNKENLMPQAYMYNKCYFKPPLTDEEVEKKVESVLKYALPPYCDGKGNIDNWKLVNHVLSTNPSYNKGNLYYLYDSKKGYYRYMDIREVQTMFFKYAINDREKTPNKAKNFSDLLMLISENASETYDEKNFINCKNGIIDIKNDKLIEHSSEYKLQIQFKANYIEDWKERFEESNFKRYLESTLDEGTIVTLQESWGLMLSPHAREVQNCFIYKGEGSNGKSLAFEIQEALIGGNEHICSIGLGDFGGDFVISSAEGKHVNIVRDDELIGKKVNKAFKSMCCGEPVQVNRKNKDIIRLGFNMTMFFGLNTMPESEDNSVGFFRRPIIIPFKKSFGTIEEVEKGIRDEVKDPELVNNIIENELDIVFMWAYEGLKRLKDNNWKVTISVASELENEAYRKECDSSYGFVKEKVIKLPKGSGAERIPKNQLFVIYENWCNRNGIKPLDIYKLGRSLAKQGLRDKSSNGVRYWIDIEVKNN